MTASTAFKRFASGKIGSAIGQTISEHTPTKEAAAGLLKATFSKAKEGLLNEFTGKYKSRLVCPIPDGNGGEMVVEGSSFGKGRWDIYLQTKIAGGGRIIQEIGSANNKTVIGKMDEYIGNHRSACEAIDASYSAHIGLPLRQLLQTPTRQTVPELNAK